MTAKSNSRTKSIEEMNEPQIKKASTTHPILIMLAILCLVTLMTYLVDSGGFEKIDGSIVPDSYQEIPKEIGPENLIRSKASEDGNKASPVGIPQMFYAIPKGLEKGGGLIFMVLIIGGTFGIVTATGAIDAALDRLLVLVKGNIYVLLPCLMLVFSAGSTFLGLASEYLLLIPILVALVSRMGISPMIGFAIVTVSVKIGYMASVTNPVPLGIAQPLLGLPLFSGTTVRFACYIAFLIVGILFLLWKATRDGHRVKAEYSGGDYVFSARQKLVILTLTIGVAILIYASHRWSWNHEHLTAYYAALSVVIAAISGLGANGAASAFVKGMRKILLASFLIGIAMAITIVLQEGRILDTIVVFLTDLVSDQGVVVAAWGMFASQLMLDFLIPSTSGQAAVSMPILGPMGELVGVPPQTTILAFLFGNGLTNMITPTSGTLLAYLATARISWSDWFRFIFPLWIIFAILSLALLWAVVQFT